MISLKISGCNSSKGLKLNSNAFKFANMLNDLTSRLPMRLPAKLSAFKSYIMTMKDKQKETEGNEMRKMRKK